MPETSIIIRTFNEEKHIENLLRAIKEQDYKNYEIIIVDSGSTDNTLEIALKFPVKVVGIESRDFTFGYALNVGCKASSGKYLVFVSAHIIPTSNQWLTNLITPFENNQVAMVYGRQMGYKNSKFSEKMDLKRLFGSSSLNSKSPLIYANNANSAIRKDLWKEHKFDEYLFGLEDIDWAKTMLEKGYLIHYEPKAAIYHIHEEEWYQVFNRYRREAIAAVRIGLEHPPQAKLSIWWMIKNLFLDLINSFPTYSHHRLEEISRFRYYQWKGSNNGWSQGKDIDFNREKNTIFFPQENRAVVVTAKHKAEIESVPILEMKPGDILIKIDYVGVCRTDLEIYDGTLGYYRDGVAQYPIVPGHEFSGTIVRIGSNNKYQERFKVGQKVVGECILARGGKLEKKEVGVINYNGAYSNYIIMPGDAIHKVPDTVDLKTAALTEPLAVVLRGIRRIQDRLAVKSSVAIMGAGPIGNLCAQALSLEGHTVSVFDKHTERLKIIEERVSHVYQNIQKLGLYDVIIETTGSKDVLEQILKESRNNSTTLLLGFPYGVIEYNFENLVGFEKVFAGSVGGDTQDFVRALELLPKFDMAHFTKVIMPLKDFDKAWNAQRSLKHFKILLRP